MDNLPLFEEYFIKMKQIQENILGFLDDNDELKNNYDKLKKYFSNPKIIGCKNDLKIILRLISKISENHHRINCFYSKIKQILQIFRDLISKNFTNLEIFNIFKGSKQIILFLLEEKIIIPDKSIAFLITNQRFRMNFYPQYFFPEFNIYYDEFLMKRMKYQYSNILEMIENDLELFNQKRKCGENDELICELIRNDSIDDFISYVNKNELKLTIQIKKSIFETNFLLNKNSINLIEYTAFFGSIKIFKYLLKNGVNLTSNIWLYAVHSNNAELIHLIEENDIHPDFDVCKNVFCESIKCHHIDIAYYLYQQFQNETNLYVNEKIQFYLRYYNFIEFSNRLNEICIQNEDQKSNFCYYLCKYDYFFLFDLMLKKIKINVNSVVVMKQKFLYVIINCHI